jgi:hypothetical protein
MELFLYICSLPSPVWGMRSSEHPFNLVTALDAELARRRRADFGFVSPRFPTRPTYSNDPDVEARRCAEYEALMNQCAVETASWNCEARRWNAERRDAMNARLRTSSEAVSMVGGTSCKPSNTSAASGPAPVPVTRLEAIDLVTSGTGLASTSQLAELTDLNAEVDAAVLEMLHYADWKRTTSQRRRAALAICAAQQNAFIATWQHKATENPGDDDTFPGAPAHSPVEVIHVQARRSDEVECGMHHSPSGDSVGDSGAPETPSTSRVLSALEVVRGSPW